MKKRRIPRLFAGVDNDVEARFRQTCTDQNARRAAARAQVTAIPPESGQLKCCLSLPADV